MMLFESVPFDKVKGRPMKPRSTIPQALRKVLKKPFLKKGRGPPLNFSDGFAISLKSLIKSHGEFIKICMFIKETQSCFLLS